MTTDVPIFVVGCQRSGTTLLRLMLDSHPEIACGPETRFLGSFEAITGSEWHRISRFGHSREYWLMKMADFFSSFQEDYARSRGKRRWADKTPLYAMHLEFILELFPDAQIVHLIRDVRDVTASHRSAFGYRAALNAPRKWSRYITEARRVGMPLLGTQYLEIRYENLVRDAEETMRGLLDYLHEPWDEAVLHYEDAPHDVPTRYWERTADRRKAVGSSGGAVYASGRSGRRRTIDPLLAASIRAFGSSTRAELGY